MLSRGLFTLILTVSSFGFSLNASAECFDVAGVWKGTCDESGFIFKETLKIKQYGCRKLDIAIRSSGFVDKYTYRMGKQRVIRDREKNSTTVLSGAYIKRKGRAEFMQLERVKTGSSSFFDILTTYLESQVIEFEGSKLKLSRYMPTKTESGQEQTCTYEKTK